MLTPQEIELPAKFKKWQGQQENVIEKIVNADRPLYLLDAPTGSGKSVIGIAAATVWRTNWLTTKVLQGEDISSKFRQMDDFSEQPPKRVIYVTKTKQLQQQLLADFPKARMIKGRENFPCMAAPQKFPDFTAADCPTQGKDSKCPYTCPYLVAKMEALKAEIAVLNDSYYLAEANGPGQFSGADFVILDEVDCLENTLLDTISMDISLATMTDFGLNPPQDWEDWTSWVRWWNDHSGQRASVVAGASSQLDLLGEKITDANIKAGRHARKLINFDRNLDSFMHETLQQLMQGKGAAINDVLKNTLSGEIPFVVCEYYQKKSKNIAGFHLKPVTVRNFCNQHLFRHAERFLGMSGTILSPVTLARELGLQEAAYDYRQIPSPFDVKNRPIYYWPVANMRKKNMDDGTALPPMLEAINQIMARYPNQKILIHTASYPLASAIRYDQVDKRGSVRLIWHDPENRIDQLEAFKQSKQPLVMVSPSFDRGVDLPGDLCRCVIIAKVPYLSLGDKQVEARLKAPGGDQWYLMKALQTLMQMTGRHIRNPQDWGDTFILDAGFGSLMARTKQFIPRWWMDAFRRIEGI